MAKASNNTSIILNLALVLSLALIIAVAESRAIINGKPSVSLMILSIKILGHLYMASIKYMKGLLYIDKFNDLCSII